VGFVEVCVRRYKGGHLHILQGAQEHDDCLTARGVRNRSPSRVDADVAAVRAVSAEMKRVAGEIKSYSLFEKMLNKTSH